MLEFNHVGLEVRNMKESFDFYTRICGAQYRRGLFFPCSGIGCYIQIDTCMIELLATLDQGASISPGLCHIAFTTDSFDDLCARLLADGRKFQTPPKRAGSGFGRLAFFYDPNGVLVELIDRPDRFLEPWEPSGAVKSWESVTIDAPNLEAAVSFYTKVLGMQLQSRRSDEAILLLHDKKLVLAGGPCGHAVRHFTLQTTQMKTFLQEYFGENILVSPGVVRQPWQDQYGCWSEVCDPNGIKIRLMEVF